MIDCSNDIRGYHDNHVKLSAETRKKLREQRNANRDRLRDGLTRNRKPLPISFQKQGSYAMRTTVQHPRNDYDIDDGVIFRKEDLVGDRGAPMEPLAVRKMVCEALQDDRFNKQPEALKNCVRVYYNEGHHVDIPVYRESGSKEAGIVREIATTAWRESNPSEINEWFDQEVARKKTVGDDDDTQLRRVIRLLKRYATSRDSWNLPSGFILTILADEAISLHDEREDRCFYNLILSIRNRLKYNLEVKNPVQNETLTKGDADPKVLDLREKLGEAITTLQILFDPGCARKNALTAWAKVFNTDCFDNEIDKDGTEKNSVVIGTAQPTQAVHKAGGGRFG